MRRIAAVSMLVALALAPAVANAQKVTPVEFTYGSAPRQFGERYPAGLETVFLLHEDGAKWNEVVPYAEELQHANFTVLALEWEKVTEKVGSEAWGPLTAQIEAAIDYARSNAAALGVDAEEFTMVGGSRGANLSLLTALNMNLAEPETIHAVVSLSGDVNPAEQISRMLKQKENHEPVNEKLITKITKTYGCQRELVKCPTEYIEAWSPFQKVTESPIGNAPATFLAASKKEEVTATWEDQQPLVEALIAKGVPEECVLPPEGHGFVYWKQISVLAITFLHAHDRADPGAEPAPESPCRETSK